LLGHAVARSEDIRKGIDVIERVLTARDLGPDEIRRA
jgi:hypothetical protein